MPPERMPSQRQSILGLMNRNANVPKLYLYRSYVDPGKEHLVEAYKNGPIGVNFEETLAWFQKQEPDTFRKAQGGFGKRDELGVRTFSYMIKTKLKPPLEKRCKTISNPANYRVSGSGMKHDYLADN